MGEPPCGSRAFAVTGLFGRFISILLRRTGRIEREVGIRTAQFVSKPFEFHAVIAKLHSLPG